MDVCVVGLGYIGLPTACLLATSGHKVLGVDIKENTVEMINKGIIPFDEVGLQQILHDALDQNFSASTEPKPADVFIIAVPTSLNKERKQADLSNVVDASKSIAELLKPNNIVIVESTVPPGTCQNIVRSILETADLDGGSKYHLAYCPERAIPGSTLLEMVNNDRIVGGVDSESSLLAKNIYSSFVRGQIFTTNLITAEMVKLMENTYRDTNIALANEFALIASDNKVDIWKAIQLANKHPRVNILIPGPGVGGHCLAIDPWFLIENSKFGNLIRISRETNDNMPSYIVKLIKELTYSIEKPVITILGVSYKKDVDDTRESPAIDIIEQLIALGYDIRAHDPYVKNFPYKLYNLKDAVQGSDCIVVVTDHTSYYEISPNDVSLLMRNKNVVDSKNVIDFDNWARNGFQILGLGKDI